MAYDPVPDPVGQIEVIEFPFRVLQEFDVIYKIQAVLSCQKRKPNSLSVRVFIISSPVCPKGVCPISWPIAIAVVNSVLRPRYEESV